MEERERGRRCGNGKEMGEARGREEERWGVKEGSEQGKGRGFMRPSVDL